MLWEEDGLWRPGLESARWELGEVNLSKSWFRAQSIERVCQSTGEKVEPFCSGPCWQALFAVSA